MSEHLNEISNISIIWTYKILNYITFYDCSFNIIHSTKWFLLRLFINNFFTQIVAVGKFILFKGITHIYSDQGNSFNFRGSGPT